MRWDIGIDLGTDFARMAELREGAVCLTQGIGVQRAEAFVYEQRVQLNAGRHLDLIR